MERLSNSGPMKRLTCLGFAVQCIGIPVMFQTCSSGLVRGTLFCPQNNFLALFGSIRLLVVDFASGLQCVIFLVTQPGIAHVRVFQNA